MFRLPASLDQVYKDSNCNELQSSSIRRQNKKKVAIMDRYTNTRANDIELQDLGSNSRFSHMPLDHPNPLEFGTAVFRESEWRRRRDCRTISVLVFFTVLFLISTAVLGTFYAFRVSAPSEVHVTTTLVQATTRVMTSEATATAIITQPTTETVTFTTLSTETTRQKAKTTSVTAVITTTLFLTTTQTSSQASSSAQPSNLVGHCIPPGLYGGMELQNINADYDEGMRGEIQDAAEHGLDIDGEDELAVALRSKFECVAEDYVSLVEACQQNYSRWASGIFCQGPPYSVTPSMVIVTDTMTTVVGGGTSTVTAPARTVTEETPRENDAQQKAVLR